MSQEVYDYVTEEDVFPARAGDHHVQNDWTYSAFILTVIGTPYIGTKAAGSYNLPPHSVPFHDAVSKHTGWFTFLFSNVSCLSVCAFIVTMNFYVLPTRLCLFTAEG
jgi:hypothetical protein